MKAGGEGAGARPSDELAYVHAAVDAERRLLQSVLAGIQDGVTVQDRTGKLLFANASAARLVGFDSPEAMVATPGPDLLRAFQMFAEDGTPLPPEKLPARTALEGRTSEMVIQYRVVATGERRWSNVRAYPVFDADGKVACAINVFRDVTDESVEAAQRGLLFRAVERFTASLDYDATLKTIAREMVPTLADWCAVDLLEDGALRRLAVEHVDPAKVALLEELRRRHPPDFRAPGSPRSVIESGKPYLQPVITEQMIRAAAKDEEHAELIARLRLCSFLVVPMIGRTGPVGALTLATAESRRVYSERDVVFASALADRAAIAIENSRLVRALEETAAQLRAADRAKDEFLATMSHELRTPLNSILGWATILRQQPGDEEKLHRGLEVIERNARAQERLVSDLLDVSRIISGKLRLAVARTALCGVVHAAAEVVRPAAEGKGVRLIVDVDPDLPSLVGDPARLQQVVWNLLINGVKFTPRGGRVTVSARWIESKVLLQVRDTGIGIAPEHLPHVFERFRQVDSSTTRRHGGLGLGLAIVRHIVEAHGGSVEAQSDGLGQGATFTVTLSIGAIDTSEAEEAREAKKDREEAEVSATPIPRGVLEGMRVLVVEDDADSMEVIREVLVGAGARVTAVSTAAAALAEPGPFDVILSDIGMAEMDGYELMKRVRSRVIGGDIPSIALTAYTRAEDRERARRAGYQEHLTKPVQPAKLVEAVARWHLQKQKR